MSENKNSTLIDPVSKLYAKALYEHALEQGTLDSIFNGYLTFCSEVVGLSELDSALSSPLFSTEEKVALVEEVGKKLETHKEILNFVKVLVSNGRYAQVQSIKSSFQALVDKKQGIVRGSVTSVASLSDAERADLARAFEKKLGKKVVLEQQTDKSILGGLIVRVQGQTYDGSLLTALNRLRESLERQSI